MRRELIREEKEEEKARKAAEIEIKRVDRVLTKQGKELAALERKNELEKRKAAAAVAAGSESDSERAAAGPSKTRKKAANPRKRVTAQFPQPVAIDPANKQEYTAAGAATVAVAADRPQARSRSGRTVVLPGRFNE